MKKIYFVRHGQSLGNVQRIFQGQETELTDEGHRQGEAVAKRIAQLDCDALISSPFVRAQQTAGYISKETTLQLETCEYFHEMLQPLHIRGISKESDEGIEYYRKFYEYYTQDEVFAEGYENFDLIVERIKKCIKFIKSHEGEKIIVVSHGTFINLLSAFLLLQESEEKSSNVSVSKSLSRMANTGITEFELNDDMWELVTWNDKAHFADN